MTPERWQQIERVYYDALARDEPQRRAFLAEVCVGDAALRFEVDTLLARENSAEHFLGTPAMEVAAQGLAVRAHAFVSGRQIGCYTILSRLGAGGMGEVYRARDTTLGREVAIKILPQLFSSDPDRLARFQREARMLASLNHPHIGAIYGLEEVEPPAGPGQAALPALILELVEGDTLAERIARGPVPLTDALTIARQVIDALEAAHEKGIVHRDLKPANIKITPEGLVKVLDLGLAKVMSGGTPETDLTRTLASTVGGTREGSVLGTAAYMSPEQARGLVVDKRTDIWAFGCVLYEMLAGRAAFTRDTSSDTLAAILEREPDWHALPDATPKGVRRLLQRSLEKDSRQRLRDIGDARTDLTEANDANVSTGGDIPASRTAKTVFAVTALSIALVIAVSAAMGSWLRAPLSSDGNVTPVRFLVPPPQGGAFEGDVERTYLAFSPDGSQLAFIAAERAGTRRIWLRPVSAIESRPLSGTEGASSLFWSPDGRSIGFFAGNKLKRLDLPGGAAVPVCDVPEGIGLSGTWGAAGEILFASVAGDAIFSVSTNGGNPVALVSPDRSRGEARVHWPWFLPDGRRFVYLTRLRDGSGQLTLSERGGRPRPILSAVSNVQWVDPDYLVFVRDGILVGQRFDLASERIVGEPFSIAEPVEYMFSTARATFATSRTGNVAYQTHKDSARLVWSDRHGARIGDIGTPGGYQSVRLSPDGTTLLFDRAQSGVGTPDLWTMDLRRGIERRLTSDPTSETFGVWLRDGRSVVFMADRGGAPHLFRKNLVTEEEDELRPAGQLQQPVDVSPDGKTLAFEERTALGNYDILTLSLSTAGPAAVLLGSRFDELALRFSPDGRAVVFMSDESGRYEVYAAPFPALTQKMRVSTGDAGLGWGRTRARRPHWSPTGREIFYLAGDRHVVSVPVRTEPLLELGTPAILFSLPEPSTWVDFAVSADGTRFLSIVSDVRGSEQPLTVVLNWPAELGR